MARKVLIQVRRGLEKDIGTLAVGELGYCEDTSKLYIGTATGNVLLVAAQTVGDMLKTIYDTNNDGKVDMAELADNVPWNGVTNKPSIFPPSSHKHNKSEITDFPTSLPANGGIADKLRIVDTRSVDSPPSYYFGQGRNMFWEFKYRTSVGNPPTNASASKTYAFILTITGWMDSSGGYPVQISVGDKNIAIRQGTSTTAWGNWFVIPNIGDIPTKLSQLKGPITWNDLRGV